MNGGISLSSLQGEVQVWVKKNFGDEPAHRALLGAFEELGELSHAHLKMEQGIRTTEDHVAAAKDAIGDTIIYLADYCNRRGFDLEEIVTQTWAEVVLRDWKKNPTSGKVE